MCAAEGAGAVGTASWRRDCARANRDVGEGRGGRGGGGYFSIVRQEREFLGDKLHETMSEREEAAKDGGFMGGGAEDGGCAPRSRCIEIVAAGKRRSPERGLILIVQWNYDYVRLDSDKKRMRLSAKRQIKSERRRKTF
jgi:hypothetical protein